MGLTAPQLTTAWGAQAVIKLIVRQASSPALFLDPYTDTRSLPFELVHPFSLAPALPHREVRGQHRAHGRQGHERIDAHAIKKRGDHGRARRRMSSSRAHSIQTTPATAKAMSPYCATFR